MTSHESLSKAIYSLAGTDIEIEARCDALEAAILMLAEECGISMEALHKCMDDVKASALQKRLEQCESLMPDVAAKLDQRPLLPSLPDDTPNQ